MLITPKKEHIIWLDQQHIGWDDAKIHITAHHYGIGIFEGLRCYATPKGPAIFRLQAHTDRLFRSAHIIGIEIPYSKAELNQAQCDVIKLNGLENAYIRPFIFYDGIIGLSLYTDSLKVHSSIISVGWDAKSYHELANSTKGVRLQTSSLVRTHPNSMFLKAKSNGNYMNNMMALKEVRACGADDALLLDQQGFITEASGANIFMVSNSTLYTPELTAALPGITRDTVFTLADELGLAVKEKQITRDELYVADEAFMTGTAVEIMPIIEVDKRKISTGKVGSITETIRNLYLSYAYGQRADQHHWLTYVNNDHLSKDFKKKALSV